MNPYLGLSLSFGLLGITLVLFGILLELRRIAHLLEIRR